METNNRSNEEFDEIVKAAVRAWGFDSHIILHQRHRDATDARGCVAYVIKEYCPHLVSHLSKVTGLSRSAIYASATVTAEHAQSDERVRKALDRMIHHLRLLPRKKKRTKKNNRVVSFTKQLFGFDYTDEEELRYKRALEEAPAFWEKMSRIGRQPLEDGMVFSIKNPLKNKGWYNG